LAASNVTFALNRGVYFLFLPIFYALPSLEYYHLPIFRRTSQTKWIRKIAKIWSGVVIVLALIMLIGYAWNWVTIGKPDPYAIEGYPSIENLIPITLGVSVLGLAIAWRWEGLGGMITIISHLVTLAIHHWLLSPRPHRL